MIQAVLFLLALSAVLTYVLELWTGFAFAGWLGDYALIDRRAAPGPYWFVMAVQTLVLFGVPALIAFSN
ncbi:MAG: hypothetical protein EA381_16540 [Planctomycetaceae bacterium]|nr:MAG: hypothetical protein EA381_16540 [Planctomycetaceae bacterium]